MPYAIIKVVLVDGNVETCFGVYVMRILKSLCYFLWINLNEYKYLNPRRYGICIYLILLLAPVGCTHQAELPVDTSADAPASKTSSESEAQSSEDQPQLTEVEQAISGGRIDEDRTNVVGLVIQQGWSGGACSGSLIAPNVVLTAQHCIAPTSSNGIACGLSTFGDPYDKDNLFVTTRTEFPQFSGYYGVLDIVIPEGTGVCGRDIALLILTQNVLSDQAVPLTPRLDEPVSVGEAFAAVGYGHTGQGEGAGIRRSIESRRVLCSGFQNGCQDNNQGIYDNEWVGNDGTCQGDSGGPALDRNEEVIGVLSRGPEGCIYPVYTDVIRYAPLIRETANIAAMVGNYQPASWVTSTEPSAGGDEDEDGLTDRYDNCPSVYNPSQQDYDQDGIGDLCDDLVSGDRGGVCPVCNRCASDDECGGQGAVCLQLEDGGVCTYPCRGSFECPETTDCVEVIDDEQFCFNADIFFSGPCPQGYLCGGESPVDPVPEDDGTCRVCERCERGEDCASGVCASVGDSPKVCTRSCESDDDCREGSMCVSDEGRQICINSDYMEVGICPEGQICGQSVMSAGEEMSGGAEAGEMMSMDPSAGETSGDSMQAGEVMIAGDMTSGVEASGDGESDDDDDVKDDSGCQTSNQTTRPFGLILLFSWILFRRRVDLMR
jgi:hypothetical protein